MSHYRPYQAYKDSGVEWLGQVPAHWKVSSVKWEFESQLGKMLQPEKKQIFDIQVPYHKAISVQWESVAAEAPESMWASPEEVDTYRIRKGDLLICEGGDVGRSAIFNGEDSEPIIIQNSIHRVRPKSGNQSAILLRLMQACRHSGWFDVLCSKATIVHFTAEKLGDFPFPLAPPEEQRAIVAHLDRETARIDSLVEKKIRFIELLREKRQALITHAVTKGLDPNVKMKDSGVEWLGEVPEHWDVCRLRRILSDSTYGISESLSDFGAVGVLRMGDIQNGEVLTDNLGFVPEVEDSLLLHKGDLVFNRTNSLEKIGKVGLVRSEPESPLSFASYLVRFRPKKGVFEEYLHYFLNSSYAGGFSRAEAIPAIGQANLNPEKYSYMFLVVPPEDEQRAIVAFVKIEVARLDSLIDKSERSIELLKERRSALITAAVTGQIDLREAA